MFEEAIRLELRPEKKQFTLVIPLDPKDRRKQFTIDNMSFELGSELMRRWNAYPAMRAVLQHIHNGGVLGQEARRMIGEALR